MSKITKLDSAAKLKEAGYCTAKQWLTKKLFPRPCALPQTFRGKDYFCKHDVLEVWPISNKRRAPVVDASPIQGHPDYFWLTDTEACESKTHWEKNGRRLADDTTPYGILSGSVGGGAKSITWNVYRESSTIAKPKKASVKRKPRTKTKAVPNVQDQTESLFSQKLNIGFAIAEIGKGNPIQLFCNKSGGFMVSSENAEYFPDDQGRLAQWDYEAHVTVPKKSKGDWPKYAALDLIEAVAGQFKDQNVKHDVDL